MFKMDSIRAGSPYGAGVFAGDGTREPTERELALAEHQGKYMATVVKRIARSQGLRQYTSLCVISTIQFVQASFVKLIQSAQFSIVPRAIHVYAPHSINSATTSIMVCYCVFSIAFNLRFGITRVLI